MDSLNALVEMLQTETALAWADRGHIAERAVIHFFSAAGVMLMALHGAWWLERRRWMYREIPGWLNFALPAFVLFVLISFREPWDVAHGQVLGKVIADYISWIVGLSVASWALYRLGPRLTEINHRIRGKK